MKLSLKKISGFLIFTLLFLGIMLLFIPKFPLKKETKNLTANNLDLKTSTSTYYLNFEISNLYGTSTDPSIYSFDAFVYGLAESEEEIMQKIANGEYAIEVFNLEDEKFELVPINDETYISDLTYSNGNFGFTFSDTLDEVSSTSIFTGLDASNSKTFYLSVVNTHDNSIYSNYEILTLNRFASDGYSNNEGVEYFSVMHTLLTEIYSFSGKITNLEDITDNLMLNIYKDDTILKSIDINESIDSTTKRFEYYINLAEEYSGLFSDIGVYTADVSYYSKKLDDIINSKRQYITETTPIITLSDVEKIEVPGPKGTTTFYSIDGKVNQAISGTVYVDVFLNGKLLKTLDTTILDEDTFTFSNLGISTQGAYSFIAYYKTNVSSYYSNEITYNISPVGTFNLSDTYYVALGETLNLNAIILNGNLSNNNINYESINNNFVTVDENGNITGNSVGTTVVSVSSEETQPSGEPALKRNITVNVLNGDIASVNAVDEDISYEFKVDNINDNFVSYRVTMCEISNEDNIECDENNKLIDEEKYEITEAKHIQTDGDNVDFTIQSGRLYYIKFTLYTESGLDSFVKGYVVYSKFAALKPEFENAVLNESNYIGPLNNETINIKIYDIDSFESSTVYQYSINDKTWVDDTLFNGYVSINSDDLLSGKNTFKTRIKSLTNENFNSKDSEELTILYDKEKPEISELEATLNTDKSLVVNIVSTDNYSGIAKYQYKLSSESTWRDISNCNNSNSCTYTIENLSSSVIFRVVDGVGNTSEEAHYKLDNTISFALENIDEEVFEVIGIAEYEILFNNQDLNPEFNTDKLSYTTEDNTIITFDTNVRYDEIHDKYYLVLNNFYNELNKSMKITSITLEEGFITYSDGSMSPKYSKDLYISVQKIVTGLEDETYEGSVTPESLYTEDFKEVILLKDGEETEYIFGDEITEVGNYELIITYNPSENISREISYFFEIVETNKEYLVLKDESFYNMMTKEESNNKYILYVKEQTSIEDFIANFEKFDANIYSNDTVINIDGTISTEAITTGIVKTGMKIILNKNNKTEEDIYQIVVKGDISGDGIVAINDLTALYKFILETKEFNELQFLAADIVVNNDVLINDLTRLYKFILGTIESL